MSHKICNLDEIWIGETKAVTVGQKNILLIRNDFGVFAYENKCPHLGVPLCLGTMSGDRLVCSAHHWEFQASTGQGINPADTCLKSYKVELRDPEIWLSEN